MKQVMKQTAKDIIQKTRDFLGDDLFTIEGSNESDSFLINVLLRAKSLAKACYLRMQVHSRRDLDPKPLESRFLALKALLTTNSLSEKEMIQALSYFTHDMVQLIKQTDNPKEQKKILKQIVQAETYSLQFHDKKPSAKVELAQSISATYEVTTKAVDCQWVEDLYRNLDEKSWFNAMPDWEKDFLSASVDEELEFYTQKTPTAGKRPGASNFGRDIFSVGDQKAVFYYHSALSKNDEDEAVAVLNDYFDNYKEEK